MNPYLKKLRERYEARRSALGDLQTRAVNENRDLTDDEMRTVHDGGVELERLASQITELTEIENRSTAVANLAAHVAPATEPATVGTETATTDETRSAVPGAPATSSTTTQDRDPGHYTRSSQHSFFADLHHARENRDDEAATRLVEHNRALSTGTQGTGVVPPKWLTDEFATLARQGRRVADRVRNIPLDDPRPLTLPKQTAGQDANVVEQSAENAATSFPDNFNTGVDVVTPKATVGGAKVSRQMIDMATPAIDLLIYGDLLAAYNQKVEAKVVATAVTAAGSAVTTYATESAFTTAATLASGKVPLVQDMLNLGIQVRAARKLPADLLIMSVLRYGAFLGLTDSAGRPLIPAPENGPANAYGTGTIPVDGRIHGLDIVASDGVTQYPESILALRSQDTILFEAPALRFRYEEPDGPETVRLGIWAYTAVLTRYAGQSAKRAVITAA